MAEPVRPLRTSFNCRVRDSAEVRLMHTEKAPVDIDIACFRAREATCWFMVNTCDQKDSADCRPP